jgi:hypothetical protein
MVRTHAQLEQVAAGRHTSSGSSRSSGMPPFQPEFTTDEEGQAISALPGDPLHPDGAASPTHRHRIIIRGMGKSGMDMALECNLPGHALAAHPPTPKL